MNNFYVYQLRRADCDLPFYVGKGVDDRAYKHLDGKDGNNQHKNNTIMKARKEGVEIMVEYIHTDLDEETSFQLEIETIKKFGRRDLNQGCLTNMTDGGDGLRGYNHSEETRLKMSKSHTGMKRDRDAVEKIRLANLGSKRSDETRARIAATKIGKKASPETRLKISESNKGRVYTAERNAKVSAGLLGKAKPKDTCIYCGFYGSNILQYHNENCKYKHSPKPEPKIQYSAEILEKMRSRADRSPKPKIKCPHCGTIGGAPIMKRYHFDNCKKLNKD